MSYAHDFYACKNNNCPDSLKNNCGRYDKAGQVVHYVPRRMHSDSSRVFCDGFDGKDRKGDR